MAVKKFFAQVAQWVAQAAQPVGNEGVCFAADAGEYGVFA